MLELNSISFQDSESWIFCFVLANDGQGLLTLSHSQGCWSSLCLLGGAGVRLQRQRRPGHTGGHNNTSIVLTFLHFTACGEYLWWPDWGAEENSGQTYSTICLLHRYISLILWQHRSHVIIVTSIVAILLLSSCQRRTPAVDSKGKQCAWAS